MQPRLPFELRRRRVQLNVRLAVTAAVHRRGAHCCRRNSKLGGFDIDLPERNGFAPGRRCAIYFATWASKFNFSTPAGRVVVPAGPGVGCR